MSPEEARRTSRKVERVIRKHDRAEALTEDEWLIFQYARHAEGCHACGTTISVGGGG